MGRVAYKERHLKHEKIHYKSQTTNKMTRPWRPLNGQKVQRIPNTIARRMKFATANIRTLRGRIREVAEMLERRIVDICCLQEMRYKNEGCTT